VLFNSFPFICLFLPVTLAVYFVLGRIGQARIAKVWLIAASLFFYGWWNPKFVSLLLASICLNYICGFLIGRTRPSRQARWLLTAGIVANLGCLGWFKYANFFIENYDRLFPGSFPFLDITLPLGISFYTFTQIAFLVDVYRGIAVEFDFANYTLFVTYFPHLIAGPILHHKQMMPQFAERRTYWVRADNLAIGLTYFCMGLVKKILLADHLSPIASNAFGASEHGVVGLSTAWAGAFAYTFQIYFDFSGYCDMAIGISRMFGVVLPFNFNSPYKAASIIDFWRRWHMTLSTFLRDYVYIPLGGNRLGHVRRHINLMATMFIGGLWHGANWTFAVWGVLHGVLLVINHHWVDLQERWKIGAKRSGLVEQAFSVTLTFFCVLVLWVFFRATTFSSALNILAGMTGLTPAAALPEVKWNFYLVAAPLIAFLFPNSQELVARLEVLRLDASATTRVACAAWGLVMGIVLCSCLWTLLMAKHSSEFLYFQF
jgi:alginate O-acetyltransferase complex protein AlgI